LWDDDYKFTQYVKGNYTQTYANNEEQFGVIVFMLLASSTQLSWQSTA